MLATLTKEYQGWVSLLKISIQAILNNVYTLFRTKWVTIKDDGFPIISSTNSYKLCFDKLDVSAH